MYVCMYVCVIINVYIHIYIYIIFIMGVYCAILMVFKWKLYSYIGLNPTNNFQLEVSLSIHRPMPALEFKPYPPAI